MSVELDEVGHSGRHRYIISILIQSYRKISSREPNDLGLLTNRESHSNPSVM
jgi:hypothetical protein